MAADEERNRQDAQSSAGTGSETANVETGVGAAVTDTTATDTGEQSTLSVADYVAQLKQIRDRVLPILQAIRQEYVGRVRRGYPIIVDNVERGGVVGLNLDPGYGVYVMTDGQSLFAELHVTSLRWDTLSNANAEKFAGEPVIERHDIDSSWTDRDFRNLVSELLSKWNYQQLRIFRVDS